jgi:effector-binding domain-containing protein
MAKKIVITFLAAIAVFLVAVFVHVGGYKNVVVTQREIPSLSFVFAEHIGPYHEVSSVMDEVEAWLKERQISCVKTFGEYLDNPKSVEAKRLRSHVGCVVNIAQAPIDLGPYKFEMRPAGRYVQAKFDGSPAIGPLKVYPQMEDYIRDHHLAVDPSAIEIYTMTGDKVATEYLMLIKSVSKAAANNY